MLMLGSREVICTPPNSLCTPLGLICFVAPSAVDIVPYGVRSIFVVYKSSLIEIEAHGHFLMRSELASLKHFFYDYNLCVNVSLLGYSVLTSTLKCSI